MTKLKLFFLSLVLTSLSVSHLQAQVFGRVGGESNLDSMIIDLADYLPPLRQIIDSAVANAPSIEYFRQRQLMFEYEMAAFNKQWLEGVRISAGYTVGNNALTDQGLFLGGYNYGVNLSIPLSVFFGQRDQAKAALAASASESAKKEETELLIRREVEETYSQLFLLRDIIKESTNAKETAEFIYEQAENQYVNGEITINQLSQLAEIRSRTATAYFELKTRFYDTYRHLERLAGLPFSKFKE